VGLDQIKVELQAWMGNDRAIAEAAWTSSFEYQKKKERADEDVKRIVNMLADLKHSVPFESVVFRWWIRLPIAIDRQFMTHRLQSASGMSGRYRTMPNEWEHAPEDILEILDKGGLKDFYSRQYEKICEDSNDFYQNAVKYYKTSEKLGRITNQEFKRLREFLRGALPQGNITERVSVMNLRSWSNFQKLRNSEHAQKEIKYIAEQMLEQVIKTNICPIAIEAIQRNNWII
jgi:thymidylate synthase (FAD)